MKFSVFLLVALVPLAFSLDTKGGSGSLSGHHQLSDLGSSGHHVSGHHVVSGHTSGSSSGFGEDDLDLNRVTLTGQTGGLSGNNRDVVTVVLDEQQPAPKPQVVVVEERLPAPKPQVVVVEERLPAPKPQVVVVERKLQQQPKPQVVVVERKLQQQPKPQVVVVERQSQALNDQVVVLGDNQSSFRRRSGSRLVSGGSLGGDREVVVVSGSGRRSGSRLVSGGSLGGDREVVVVEGSGRRSGNSEVLVLGGETSNAGLTSSRRVVSTLGDDVAANDDVVRLVLNQGQRSSGSRNSRYYLVAGENSQSGLLPESQTRYTLQKRS